MTCASEATGTASPASANENKITEEARRIPIPSRLSIVIARLRAKCREIKAHLMIVDRSREPAFVARTSLRELHCSEPAGLLRPVVPYVADHLFDRPNFQCLTV